MNIERMEALANFLETSPEVQNHFDMGSFISTDLEPEVEISRKSIQGGCGTTACIGGWACLLFGHDRDTVGHQTAQKILGLTNAQANQLFYPVGPEADTPREAAKLVREIMEWVS